MPTNSRLLPASSCSAIEQVGGGGAAQPQRRHAEVVQFGADLRSPRSSVGNLLRPTQKPKDPMRVRSVVRHGPHSASIAAHVG